jgi:hypothetical protein
MNTEYSSATSQAAVWKQRAGNPYGTIPDTPNHSGAPLYVAKGVHTAPELPATAIHMLLARWSKWQREDD